MNDDAQACEAPSSADDIEAQIRAGTRLLTAQELAPRLHFSSAWGFQAVMNLVRRGLIPACRIGGGRAKAMFHWPSVVAAIEDASTQARIARKHPSRQTLSRRRKPQPNGDNGNSDSAPAAGRDRA